MELIIVLPCYNEANRFNKSKYSDFLKQSPEVKLLFVDDGSEDHTLDVLLQMKDTFNDQVEVLEGKTNKGKAAAVFAGFRYAFENLRFKKIAYLDADLSTDLEECVSIAEQVNGHVQFAFGSRILKIDNHIKRKWYRHYLGRGVATLISRSLNLAVYDTQCGCKIFEASLARKLFQYPFISRWLFDVELFHRMIRLYGNEEMPKHTLEVPLRSWVDVNDSRVKFTYFFRMWYDLYNINKQYR